MRALAEDKWFSKLAARAIGIPTAEGAIYDCATDLKIPPPFPGPYFVKNRFGAASEGIDAAIDPGRLGGRGARRRRPSWQRGMSVLVEAYAPGIDITVPVLGGDAPMALGIVRPGSDRVERHHHRGPEARTIPWATRCSRAGARPSDLDRAVDADVAALWKAAGPMDYLRLDYRFDPDTGRRVFLEFNICCHIGRSGAICLAASQWGLTQADVLGHVVEFSLRRQGVNKEKRRWAQ